MSAAAERAFFDALREQPAEDGPRLIYADWLEEHGEPDRAEFIRVQCALARLPDDDRARPQLQVREAILREANELRWANPVRPFVTAWEFRRGVIDSVSVDTGQFLTNGPALFEIAPVRKVRFVDVGDRLIELVQARSLKHVRELDLVGNELGNRGPSLLARSPLLGRLDALDLGFTELDDRGLRVLAVSPAFGGLRSLRINDNSRIGAAGLRAIAESAYLTDLTDLDLSGNGLSEASIRPLLTGPPGSRLVRLSIARNRLGDAGIALFAGSSVLGRMLVADSWLDLRHVELGPTGTRALAAAPGLAGASAIDLDGNAIGDAGLAALAESPHVRQLRTLKLRENRISDDGVRHLARSPLMATVVHLDLRGNLITMAAQDRLHEASVQHDWRGKLELLTDSNLLRRPPGPLAWTVGRTPT